MGQRPPLNGGRRRGSVKEVCDTIWIEGVRETLERWRKHLFPTSGRRVGEESGEQHREKMFSAGPLYIGDPPLQSDALQDHRITDVSASAGEAEANPTQNLTFPQKGKK
jgi:hypothetical protein